MAKKTGFKDAGALKKSSYVLMGFLKKAAPAGAGGAAGNDASPGCPGGASPASQPGGPTTSQQQSQQGVAGAAGASTVRKGQRERTFDDVFLKPEGPHILR